MTKSRSNNAIPPYFSLAACEVCHVVFAELQTAFDLRRKGNDGHTLCLSHDPEAEETVVWLTEAGFEEANK